ncbi:MarR family transcriptional regulator [Aliivibrio kagoshimensis]|uniref:MarR family transcriptional regulator n=1 Tax=Aliivibrio kagoshimensis TaxID=2910230 RepID=UPI003D1299F4
MSVHVNVSMLTGRTMGQSRQATQRVADIMVKGGLLTWIDNPGHKKAKLVI